MSPMVSSDAKQLYILSWDISYIRQDSAHLETRLSFRTGYTAEIDEKSASEIMAPLAMGCPAHRAEH
jgi:hypothetical protein